MRSRLKAHFSLDQMSTTLEDLVETAMLLDYNGRDVVGSWCRHPKYAKNINTNSGGFTHAFYQFCADFPIDTWRRSGTATHTNPALGRSES